MDIIDGVEFLTIEHPDIVWLKLKKSYFGLDNNIIPLLLYISPNNSVCSSKIDIFEKLFNGICKLKERGGKCITMGDFNTATCTTLDFVVPSKAVICTVW